MFFSTKISHVVEELKRRENLREFLRIKEDVPETGYVYAFLSRFNLNSFISMILRILNSITKRRARNTKLIVDCTDVSVDTGSGNVNRQISKEKITGGDTQQKECSWA